MGCGLPVPDPWDLVDVLEYYLLLANCQSRVYYHLRHTHVLLQHGSFYKQYLVTVS